MDKKITLVLSTLFISQFYTTIDAQINHAGTICVDTGYNYTYEDLYETNLDLLIKDLVSKSLVIKFHNHTVGRTPNKVHGLFQCRNDLSLDVCNSCIQDASREVTKNCTLYGEAFISYYECMIRYANRTILSLSETTPWWQQWDLKNVSNYDEFAPILGDAMDEVLENASSSSPYFASTVSNYTSFQELYTFGQCTPDITSEECFNCLTIAFSNMIQCCNQSRQANIFAPSCVLRYSTVGPLINTSRNSSPTAPPPQIDPHLGPDSPPSEDASLNPGIIVVITICLVVGFIGLGVVIWICICRKKPKESTREVPPISPRGLQDDDAESLRNTEFIQYDLQTLKAATNGFSAENVLGEGGFGIVYKGTFENDHHLAIKRLSGSTSGQGTKQFMTEARLLANLQHKNLVRFVGSCSEGNEKLLVYEFMPNLSLDRFLFDPRIRRLLDWIKRHKIILGTARGLQYLHEDSRLTIIHRDLKPANILLDEEMNPKIADFGLAKLFEVEQKRGNTSRVMGTFGYMAPEYITTGEYSSKSDVYSFGIMILEIVSGQKNRISNQSPSIKDLPFHAWRLWTAGRSFELIDPAICNNCSSHDVTRCIQIGLLCVQANAEERPNMSLVVLMLTGSIDLSLPMAPMTPTRQFIMTNSYTSEGQSYPYTKTVTGHDEQDEDLYPTPR